MAEKERRDRRAAVSLAWNYYHGSHWRPLVSSGAYDPNVIINLCRQVVDRQVAFLFPEMPGLQLDVRQETADEHALREGWAQAGGVSALTALALTGAVTGHVFAKVGRTPDGRMRLVNLNPENVLRWWAADDVETTLWYEIQFRVGKMLYRQDVVAVGDSSGSLPSANVQSAGGHWEILNWQLVNGSWLTTGEPMFWPYAEGPVVDWPHIPVPFQAYGSSAIEHRELNDHINKVTSDVAKMLHEHAFPKTVGTGVGAAELKPVDADGSLWTVKNSNARFTNLALDPQALEPAVTYVAELKRAFMAQARVVVLEGDIADFQRVTNLGVRALFLDQIAANEQLRRQYGRGIVDVSRRFERLLGLPATEPKVIWPDPLPQDPMESMRVLALEREHGLVDRETMIQERGRDPEAVLARLSEEGVNGLMALGGVF